MSYECPTCHLVSHNPNDERERYCVGCHAFVDWKAKLDAIDVTKVDSPVLRRLIQEVRDGTTPAGAYNRTYSRHNRS